jgi:hypothetical protein
LILVVLLSGNAGPGIFIGAFFIFYFASNEGEKMWLAAEEERVAEDIFAWILA